MIERISKYRIDSILGHGAMGLVYKATDEAINRTVAIKTIHPHLLLDEAGAELIKRFKTEATAAARCQHHNIVSIYDFGQHEETPFIVMEFVKGQGLDRLLKALTPISLERISSILLGICAGLAYAHQQNIVHRDIKPANIIVLDDYTVKVADFGIAKIETSEMTQIGLTLGTASYMAPEQSAGLAIDCRVDIYAFGVVAFELFSLCSDLPAELCQYSITSNIEANKAKKINLNKKLPKSIAKFLDNCLNPDVSLRFNNMTEVMNAYQLAMSDIGTSSQQNTSQTSTPTITPNSAPVSSTKLDFNFDLNPEFLAIIEKKADFVDDAPTQITQAKPVQPIAIEKTLTPAPKNDVVKEAQKALTTLDLIRLLKNIHPILNHDWMESVPRILAQLDEDSRRRCYKNILEPKDISITSTGKFIFTGQRNLNNAKKVLVTRQLNALADKLLRIVGEISKTRNVLSIGDSLEAGFNLISEVNTEDNLAQQKEKVFLMESFLYDFAITLRQHDFDVPENRRGLTVDIIKAFIIEVYIKQKILNYWFSPLPLRELKKDSNPFINTELFDAAKVRRLSIIPTDRYFFLIGEVPKFGLDPYSVRRFLVEDVSMGGRFVYFNILAINRTTLTNPHYQATVRENISRVVTIQRQLNSDIIELVDSLENYQISYLLPLLTKPLDADGTNLQTIIEDRLRDYERNLCILVLNKVTKGLKEKAKSPDDYEFLFFGLKSFLIEALGDIRDFYYQTSARWSTKSQEMEFKLVSYLRLLEKRKNSVFNPDRLAVLAMDADLDYRKPVEDLTKIVESTIPVILNIKDVLKEASRQAAEERSKFQEFWDGFLGRKRIEPKSVQLLLDKTAQESYVSIVRIPKRYKKTSIYLEFEGLIGIDERVRHYAFPKGEEGISLLPMLIRLPEDTRDFDILAVKDLLKPTLFSQFGNTA